MGAERLAADDEDAAVAQAPVCCLDRSVSLPAATGGLISSTRRWQPVTTALLAVVALHLAHATGLPEIGYLVKVDLFFLHTDLTLGSSLIALVVEHRLDAAGRSEAAQRVLTWERRLFLLVVLVGWSAVFALGLR